jgi:hypothetical protein
MACADDHDVRVEIAHGPPDAENSQIGQLGLRRPRPEASEIARTIRKTL